VKLNRKDIVRIPNDVKECLIIFPDGEQYLIKAEDLKLFIRRRGRRIEEKNS
jgi:hypothetical protein